MSAGLRSKTQKTFYMERREMKERQPWLQECEKPVEPVGSLPGKRGLVEASVAGVGLNLREGLPDGERVQTAG